jgi:hypothetical protein
MLVTHAPVFKVTSKSRWVRSFIVDKNKQHPQFQTITVCESVRKCVSVCVCVCVCERARAREE